MKETDKGYAEWVAMSDELAKIKRRFASLQIAMIVSLGVLIAREPEAQKLDPRIERIDGGLKLQAQALRGMLKEWKEFKEVRVERERCPTSKKARNECANCRQVWLHDHAEWQHVESTNAITCEIKPGTPYGAVMDTCEVKPWQRDLMAVTTYPVTVFNVGGGVVYDSANLTVK